MIDITIDLPPSANALKRPGKRRFVATANYKLWQALAGWQILALHDRGVGQPVRGEITGGIQVPTKMRGDIDNRIKGILDLLVSMGLTDDDKLVQRVWIGRSEVVPAGKARVRVEACLSAPFEGMRDAR